MRFKISLEHAAELLGMSRATLYRKVKAQKVPYRKIGTAAVFFEPEDIDRILADTLVPPEGEQTTTTSTT